MTTPPRNRPTREAPELGAMVRRMLAALVRRAEAGDLFALEQLAELRDQLPGYLARAAWGAHHGPAGYSYGEVGRELGVSRQAARQLAEAGRQE
jgi:hypothetical protein